MKDRLIQIVQEAGGAVQMPLAGGEMDYEEAGGCACRKPWRHSAGTFCKKTPGQRAYGGLRKRSTAPLRRRRF